MRRKDQETKPTGETKPSLMIGKQPRNNQKQPAPSSKTPREGERRARTLHSQNIRAALLRKRKAQHRHASHPITTVYVPNISLKRRNYVLSFLFFQTTSQATPALRTVQAQLTRPSSTHHRVRGRDAAAGSRPPRSRSNPSSCWCGPCGRAQTRPSASW